jgi:hypothetical protein
LKERKQKIEDKHGFSEVLSLYGSASPGYRTAREKAKDELQPVMEEIAKVQGECGRYETLQRKAEWQFNIAQRHIEEMMDDPYIGPLLEPIALQGGKQTWLFVEERKLLEPIVSAIFSGERFERAAWGSSPIPSKGLIAPVEKGPDIKSLQRYHPLLDGE